MKILIIGGGVVGSNMLKIFPEAVVHDPGKGIFAPFPFETSFDLAFVCVPTDMREDGSADTSIVRSVIEEHKNHVDVFCIRSTVPPGTTEELNALHPCVFQPEYYGATVHANAPAYDFVILGGCRNLCYTVAEAYKEKYTGDLRIHYTDSRTAELCKYMENAFLALKVTFCNEFARAAHAFGVDYDELRELWLLDPRIGRSHTVVYRDHPYYKSHCFDKDIPAIIEAARCAGYPMHLLNAARRVNDRFKTEGK